MNRTIEEIKEHTELQIETTNKAVKLFNSMGLGAPKIMLETNN